MSTTSSDRLTLEIRDLAWVIYFLSKVAPIAKSEQDILLDLIGKFEREYTKLKLQL